MEEEAVSSDEEEVAVPSYTALMQTLSAEVGPQAKRRKLNTSKEPKFQELEENNTPPAQTDVDLDEEAEEEEPENVADDILEVEDEVEDLEDPFEAHFANPDENSLTIKLKALAEKQWSSQNTVIPKIGKVTMSIPGEKLPVHAANPKVLGPKDLKLKQKLAIAFLKDKVSFNPLEKTVADVVFNYQDMLFCGRTPRNAQDLRRLTCLHAVNHVFK